MIGIEIKIEFEEIEPEGRKCNICKQLIIGKAFVGMVQIGDPQNVNILNWIFCEECKDKFEK